MYMALMVSAVVLAVGGIAIRGLQAVWLYSSSAPWLITQLMRGKGDPANSLSALPPLGITAGLAQGWGNPTKTVEECGVQIG